MIGKLCNTLNRQLSEWKATYQFLWKENSYITVYDRGKITYDHEGKPVSLLSSMIDMTYFYEEYFRTRQKHDILNAFVHLAANELKSPVASLNKATSVAKENVNSWAKLHKLLTKMDSAVDRLALIMSSLSDIAKAQHRETLADKIHLPNLLHQICEELVPDQRILQLRLRATRIHYIESFLQSMLGIILDHVVSLTNEAEKLKIQVSTHRNDGYFVITVKDKEALIDKKNERDS